MRTVQIFKITNFTSGNFPSFVTEFGEGAATKQKSVKKGTFSLNEDNAFSECMLLSEIPQQERQFSEELTRKFNFSALIPFPNLGSYSFPKIQGTQKFRKKNTINPNGMTDRKIVSNQRAAQLIIDMILDIIYVHFVADTDAEKYHFRIISPMILDTEKYHFRILSAMILDREIPCPNLVSTISRLAMLFRATPPIAR